MSEMINRAIKAACAIPPSPKWPPCKWPDCTCEQTPAMVKAAIAAMREPTAAMVQAADVAEYHGRRYALREIAREWRDMIDEALKP